MSGAEKKNVILKSNGGPLNIADPVQYGAEEFVAAHMWLDSMNIPDQELSLIGRVRLLCKEERDNATRVANGRWWYWSIMTGILFVVFVLPMAIRGCR